MVNKLAMRRVRCVKNIDVKLQERMPNCNEKSTRVLIGSGDGGAVGTSDTDVEGCTSLLEK